MIFGLGAIIFFISGVRAFLSRSSLVWVKEVLRSALGLSLMASVIFPEWGMMTIVLDVLVVMVVIFVLRASVQAQTEDDK